MDLLSFFSGRLFWLLFAGVFACFFFVCFLLWRERELEHLELRIGRGGSDVPNSVLNRLRCRGCGEFPTVDTGSLRGSCVCDGSGSFAKTVPVPIVFLDQSGLQVQPVGSLAELQQLVMDHLFKLEVLVSQSDPEHPLSQPSGDCDEYLEALDDFRISIRELGSVSNDWSTDGLGKALADYLFRFREIVSLNGPTAPFCLPLVSDVREFYLGEMESFRVAANVLKESCFNGLVESLESEVA